MSRIMLTILMVAGVCFGLMFFVGCESDAQSGAAIGALAGAGVGQLAGRSPESTLIGAAVGGGAGYMIGNEQDKKKAAAERQQIYQEMNTITINVTNSNGSITPVKLAKQGVVYIGPRGETYTNIPTQEQLKQAGYGF